ncbi:MAG: alpha/beta hydrolase [Chloroflexota bacterium]|nr:alpha/beta hydrolase [Chloroflexota bacterium]
MERHRLHVGGAFISYEVSGEGHPVVLVHGLGASGRWWARNVGVLVRHFRVYVIDLIGFGWSGGQAFALEKASGYLAKWMDALAIARASFVGHSMGGYVIADLAADHARRVDRLVLVDAAGLPFAPAYPRHVLNLVRSLRYVSPRFVPISLLDTLRAGPLTVWQGVRQVLASDLTEKLELVKAPTLVVWGAGDSLIPVETGERLSGYLRDGRFVRIEASGHNPMWERPDEFNETVLEFLTSVTVAPGVAPAGRDVATPGAR